MQTRANLQPAYVLHRRPYSNTSLLLELFTREDGRLPAIAKGVRASRRPGAAVLQPFVPLLVGLSGRGEVKTLCQADPAGRGAGLAGRSLYCGFYVNELVTRLLGRYDPSPGLFQCYGRVLQDLAGQPDAEPPLRRFEVDLLRELGYGLQLVEDAGTGQAVDAGVRYRYEVERGPVEAAATDRGACSGRTLLALAGRAPMGPEEARESRRLMRDLLAHYLDGQPIRSRELFGAS